MGFNSAFKGLRVLIFSKEMKTSVKHLQLRECNFLSHNKHTSGMCTSRNIYVRMLYLEIIKLLALQETQVFLKRMEINHAMFCFKVKQMSSVSLLFYQNYKIHKKIGRF